MGDYIFWLAVYPFFEKNIFKWGNLLYYSFKIFPRF